MNDNVTRLTPPTSCEFPHCEIKGATVGFVKLFKKNLCVGHRKILMQAETYRRQIEDEDNRSKEEMGIIDRLNHISTKGERVYVIDRKLMEDIKGLLVDQAIKIKELEDERTAASRAQKAPDIEGT